MKEDLRSEEQKKLEEKIRLLRSRMVIAVEKKKFFGLDHQVRKVQKNLQLMRRV